MSASRGAVAAAEQLEHAAEAQHARRRLRREADVVAEALAEVAPAPAELLARARRSRRRRGRREPAPGVGDVRRHARRAVEPARAAPASSSAKRARQSGASWHARDELAPAPVQQRVERDDAAAQLARRHAEQPPDRERRELELEPAWCPPCRVSAYPSSKPAANEPKRSPSTSISGPKEMMTVTSGAGTSRRRSGARRVLRVAAVAQHVAAQRRVRRGVHHLPAARARTRGAGRARAQTPVGVTR